MGQAYIPLQQKGSHLGECHTRTTGPVSLLHEEQHQCLCGCSPRGCCDLLISPSRSTWGPAQAQPSHAVFCCPRGLGPGPAVVPPCSPHAPGPCHAQGQASPPLLARGGPGCSQAAAGGSSALPAQSALAEFQALAGRDLQCCLCFP